MQFNSIKFNSVTDIVICGGLTKYKISCDQKAPVQVAWAYLKDARTPPSEASGGGAAQAGHEG